MEGLARLEYRGYDSAGVALVTEDGVTSREAGRQAREPPVALEAAPARAVARPASATPAGPPTAGPTDQNAHPHRGGDDGKLALIHNGIIENFHALKKGCWPRASSSRSETDTEVAAQLVAREYDRTGDLTEAMLKRRATGSRAPSPCSRCTPTAPASSSAPAATARSSSASVTARTSSAPTSPRSSATPGTRSSSARTRSSRSPPTATRSSTSTARPAEGKAYEVTWDAAAAEKGGYATFMEKEINDQPHAVADTLLGPHRRRRPARARRACGSARSSCAPSTASSSSPAAPPPTPAWSPSTRSSTGPASPSRSPWPTSSATATRSSTRARSWCRSASPARRWTP